jgi:DNA polymerase III gamma/tau subunit
MIGNESTIKSLKKEVTNGSHVFLFVGNAGCGKTTMARIMAKELNVGALSIREINSADNRGIDTAREIMEQMRYNPSDGDCLVWILDEMHMQTNPAQNALLKALEETPEHVYFFLCTTNPEKLIAPLKSRCTIINMKPLTNEQTLRLLKRTCNQERIRVGVSILLRIAEMAQGGSRKALKLLAKVIYLDNDEERLEVIKNAEPLDEAPETINFCRALINPKTSWGSIAKLLKEIDLSDSEKVRFAVLGYCNAILLSGKMNSRIVHIMESFSESSYSNGKFQITLATIDALSYEG